MRQNQLVRPARPVSHHQQVDVEGTGRPSCPLVRTTCLPFKGLGEPKQLVGRTCHLRLHDRVQKRGLLLGRVRRVGLRLVHRRAGRHSHLLRDVQPLDRCLKVSRAIAQIRSETEVGSRHREKDGKQRIRRDSF
jgi:hypothetical protein